MNKRVVYDNYPELLEVGIPCFGHYENKSPYVKLIREHHNGCYEICFLESGMQPYFIYPDAEDENKQDLYRLYGGETFISYPYQYHSTGSFFQQRGNLYWIQLDSECPRLLNQTEENTNLLKNALATINRHIIRVPPSITARMIEAYRSVLDANKEHVFRMCSLLSVYILDLADFNRKIKSEVYRYGSLTSLGNEATQIIYISGNSLTVTISGLLTTFLTRYSVNSTKFIDHLFAFFLCCSFFSSCLFYLSFFSFSFFFFFFRSF